MRYSCWLILTIALFMLNTALGKSTEEKSVNDTRNAKCLLFKKRYLSDEIMNMTYTKRPSVPAPGKYWILKWYNFEIPIPAVRYTHVSVSSNYKGIRAIMLIRKKNVVMVYANVNRNEPIKDTFATTSAGQVIKGKPQIITSNVGESATSKMSGRPLRFSDTLMMGYEITPASVTCNNKTLKAEALNMYLLYLKGMAAPDELLAIHKGVGVFTGWMKKSFMHFKKRTPKYTYSINIIRRQKPDIFFNFSYRLPVSSSFHSLPYLIGGEKLVSNSKPPPWFVSLNRALKTEARKDWDQYIVEARKAKFYEKNIQRLVDDLNKRDNLNK